MIHFSEYIPIVKECMTVSAFSNIHLPQSQVSQIVNAALPKTPKEASHAVQDCDPSTQESETGRLLVQGHTKLHSEFEASLGYIARSCLKKKF
jgi:hypothetical protein